MGLLPGYVGYVLGRRRERPEVAWAHELDAHAEELRRVVEDLQRENAVLGRAVEAGQRVVPILRPRNDEERERAAAFVAALRAAAETADYDVT